jgi:hypothetical protein
MDGINKDTIIFSRYQIPGLADGLFCRTEQWRMVQILYSFWTTQSEGLE